MAVSQPSVGDEAVRHFVFIVRNPVGRGGGGAVGRCANQIVLTPAAPVVTAHQPSERGAMDGKS